MMRRRALRRRLPLLSALALAGCLRTFEPAAAPPAEPVPEAAAVDEFVALLRSARSRAGCPELAWDARAAAVAEAHSTDMLRRGYLSHTAPDGRGPFERMRDAGIRYSAAAENIAYGARTGARVYEQWRASAGHRKNMLNCTYTRHGVGRAGDRWTHVLYAP